MGLGRQSEAYAKIHFDSEKDKWTHKCEANIKHHL